MNDRPEVCPGTGQPSFGLSLVGEDQAQCPICETPQRVWPYPLRPTMPSDARFVLHRLPGPILCAGSGLPARLMARSTDRCQCLHPMSVHREFPDMRCDECACTSPVRVIECGLCGAPADVRGESMIAVAHARSGT